MKKLFILFALFSLLGCQDNDSVAKLPQFNISDDYLCISGCDVVCKFDEKITIEQSEEVISVESPTAGHGDGIISVHGDIYYQDDVCTCEGRINHFSGKLTADCTCDHTQCQTVTYFSQAARDKCILSEICCKRNPLLCL